LSYRDVQEILMERGTLVSHEAIHQWCSKFGQDYANRLRRRLQGAQGRLCPWLYRECQIAFGPIPMPRRS
jgi:transposase-like protein